MENDLITKILATAPWAAPLIGLAVLWRKDIGAMLLSGRGDRAMETLLQTMVGQFGENLKHFGTLASNAEKWLREQERTTKAIDDLHETQRQILNEVVRGSNQKGG